MENLKKVIRGLVFLAGLFGILIGLSVVMQPEVAAYNVDHVEDKIFEFNREAEDTIDVVIVGDSETYSAYSPLQIWKDYGITSYICGTSAQRLCDTKTILQGCFEKQSPKIVILETNCLFRYAGIDQDPDAKITNKASKLLPVLQYHNRWKEFVDPDNRDHISKETIRKGFRLRTEIVPYKGGEWMEETDKRKKFARLVEDYLVEIKDFCKDNGAELVLVSTPAPTNWTYAKYNTVSDWAIKHGVTYLDMNFVHKEMGIDWSKDTRDGGNHMNYEGAKKVTAYFGNYLSTEFDLVDHRGDEKYKSWDESVEQSGLKFD